MQRVAVPNIQWRVLVRTLLHRLSLWQMIALVIALGAFWDGAGYVAKGNAVAQSPSLALLREQPGGMHTHGLIMLVIVVAILSTIDGRPKAARRVMIGVFAYSVWIMCSLFIGWKISHQVVWSAPSKWFIIALLAIILAYKSGQQEGVHRDES